MLQLIILGTHGAFVENGEQYQTAALITDGRTNYLIDAGFTILPALSQVGIALSTVNGVFVTHVHPDHVGGIGDLAFRKYYMEKTKLHVVAPDDVWEELHCYLDAILTPFNTWNGRISHRLSEIVDISRVPVDRDGRSLPFSPDMDSTMEISSEPVLHIPGKPCCAYTIRDRKSGKAFWWSGDMVCQQEILEAVAADDTVDTMFVDCHTAPAWPNTVHCHLDQMHALPLFVTTKIKLIHWGTGDPTVPSDTPYAHIGDIFKL